jgi:anti-sigma factor RsiW
MPVEHVTERDIEAYFDGSLELEHRLAVETFLARHPDAAARLFGSLSTDTALRLLSHRPSDSDAPFGETAAALSRRLSKRSPRRRRFPSLRLAAAAIAVFVVSVAGLGLTLSSAEAQPPDYVGDAVMSYRTGLLRAAMESQVETPRLDAEEIRRSIKIRVPHLPGGWTITDVQIFPSDLGPALQIMVRTGQGRDISIFAVHDRSAAPKIPVAIRHGEASVAYWRKGDVSYALTGVEAPEALDLVAEDLAVN